MGRFLPIKRHTEVYAELFGRQVKKSDFWLVREVGGVPEVRFRGGRGQCVRRDSLPTMRERVEREMSAAGAPGPRRRHSLAAIEMDKLK
jgi:hypothetical protein